MQDGRKLSDKPETPDKPEKFDNKQITR